MFSAIRLAYKYLKWYWSASNRHGHGVHSPFVYSFIRKVLMDREAVAGADEIEILRRELLRDKRSVGITELGAGSLQVKGKQKKISRIAATSLKPRRYAELLARIAKYFNASTILELGTSLGITTIYLSGNSKVYTIEGDPAIAEIASETFRTIGSNKPGSGPIELFTGDFDGILPTVLQKTGKIDMAYIDGNHRLEPTLRYYDHIRPELSGQGFMVFDDIYWSNEMEQAWNAIKEKPEVTLTIDLFFIGLVFFDTSFKEKQHFRLRH